MRHKNFLFLAMFVLTTACTEEFDLQLNAKQKLVIEAELTNGRPPYYVRLGLSDSKTDVLYNQRVDDALIIISDDCGVVDTLIPAKDSILTYEILEGGKIGEPFMEFIPELTRCYFQTTKLQGQAGHTYKMRVEWRGDVYTSECTMPKSIKIDSLGYPNREIDATPMVWFVDDSTTANYYLIKKGYRFWPITYSTAQGTWAASVLSDEHMTKGSHGIDICSGVSVESWQKETWDFSYYFPIQRLILYSITQEAYNYYTSLANQIRYDGGVYTPSPASAPTNIKGGALGFFNVASIDEKLCVCSKEDEDNWYVW